MTGSVCGKSDDPKPLVALFKPSNTQTRDNDSYHCIQRLLGIELIFDFKACELQAHPSFSQKILLPM